MAQAVCAEKNYFRVSSWPDSEVKDDAAPERAARRQKRKPGTMIPHSASLNAGQEAQRDAVSLTRRSAAAGRNDGSKTSAALSFALK